MHSYPDCEDLTDDVYGLAATLEPEDRLAVGLHALMSMLEKMGPDDAQRMREETAKRFGGRFCGGEMCGMMVELIDAHLAGIAKAQQPFASTSSLQVTTGTESGLPRILCTNRLPSVGQIVIVFSENTGPHQGLYTEAGLWVDMFGSVLQRVTHWWPLADSEMNPVEWSAGQQRCA